MTERDEFSCAEAGTEEMGRAGAASVRAGRLLVHPTGTVYGIGGRDLPGDDRRICAAKGRPYGPLIRLVLNESSARTWLPGLRWSAAAEQLADRYWPGPLTLVLPNQAGTTVAVRAESHPVTRAVLRALDAPLTSTSLNASGIPPAVSEADARRAVDDLVEPGPVTLLLAGELPGPPPSSLVGVDGDEVTVIREGSVSRHAVYETLGRAGDR